MDAVPGNAPEELVRGRGNGSMRETKPAAEDEGVGAEGRAEGLVLGPTRPEGGKADCTITRAEPGVVAGTPLPLPPLAFGMEVEMPPEPFALADGSTPFASPVFPPKAAGAGVPKDAPGAPNVALVWFAASALEVVIRAKLGTLLEFENDEAGGTAAFRFAGAGAAIPTPAYGTAVGPEKAMPALPEPVPLPAKKTGVDDGMPLGVGPKL